MTLKHNPPEFGWSADAWTLDLPYPTPIVWRHGGGGRDAVIVYQGGKPRRVLWLKDATAIRLF